MKTDWSHLDKFRQQVPPYSSPLRATYGSFVLKHTESGCELRIIAVDGQDTGWEHVSVHAYDPIFKKVRTPTWNQMCYVKSLFWQPDEAVIQFHPPEKDYVNVHDHVLHLWRPTQPFPMPPKICV